jgi:hypothetical protein
LSPMIPVLRLLPATFAKSSTPTLSPPPSLGALLPTRARRPPPLPSVPLLSRAAPVMCVPPAASAPPSLPSPAPQIGHPNPPSMSRTISPLTATGATRTLAPLPSPPIAPHVVAQRLSVTGLPSALGAWRPSTACRATLLSSTGIALMAMPPITVSSSSARARLSLPP